MKTGVCSICGSQKEVFRMRRQKCYFDYCPTDYSHNLGRAFVNVLNGGRFVPSLKPGVSEKKAFELQQGWKALGKAEW